MKGCAGGSRGHAITITTSMEQSYLTDAVHLATDVTKPVTDVTSWL